MNIERNFVEESEVLRKVWDNHNPLYPKEKILKLNRPQDIISGTSFFPVGDGIYKPENRLDYKFPYNGIMVLGQDWGDEADLCMAVKKNNEINGPTWRNLKEWIKEEKIGIQIKDCFFTNAIMGIRKIKEDETKNNSKPHPAFEKGEEEFLGKCKEFFIQQVDKQKPRLIICLGARVRNFLINHIPSKHWDSKDSGKLLCNIDILNKERVKIHNTNFVSIFHPSFWQSNKTKFRYGDLTEDNAIIALLKDANKKSLQH